jgi:hypothetical protein
MKLMIELQEPYAEELELRAFSSGKTVKEYVKASVKADVEAGMSFDEKDCPVQGTRRGSKMKSAPVIPGALETWC